MTSQRDRAREHFPAVLLGVLGIIQALALELLWEHGADALAAWRELGTPLTGWLQLTSLYLGIVVAWVMYATMVLRFAWTPRFLDLVFPFVLGLLEFLLATSLGPDSAATFLAVLAAIFAVASSTTWGIYGVLEREGAVQDLGARRKLASYTPAIVAVVVLLAAAAATRRAGPDSTVALVCMAAACAGLLAQLVTFRHYWRIDIDGSPGPVD